MVGEVALVVEVGAVVEVEVVAAEVDVVGTKGLS